MIELPRFSGLEKNRTESERVQFVQALTRAGYDPVGVGAVIQLESARSWSPNVKGPKGAFSMAPGYPVGLLQFAPQTARTLGTSTEALEQMTFEEQLPFVVAYYNLWGPGAFSRPGDYYLAGWGAHPSTPDSTVLASQGENAYTKNQALDVDRDGRITAAELRGLVDRTIAGARSRGVWQVDESQTVIPSSGRLSSGVSVPFGTVSALAIALSATVIFWRTLSR
jgi:hypothetical protein